jgi:hypothetical protein
MSKQHAGIFRRLLDRVQPQGHRARGGQHHIISFLAQLRDVGQKTMHEGVFQGQPAIIGQQAGPDFHDDAVSNTHKRLLRGAERCCSAKRLSAKYFAFKFFQPQKPDAAMQYRRVHLIIYGAKLSDCLPSRFSAPSEI